MRRTCLVGLLAALILAGCSPRREAPLAAVETEEEHTTLPMPREVGDGKSKEAVVPTVKRALEEHVGK
jgi:hypothetical protein